MFNFKVDYYDEPGLAVLAGPHSQEDYHLAGPHSQEDYQAAAQVGILVAK